MKQYIFHYNEEQKRKKVIILENNNIEGVVEIPSDYEETHTIEELFLDGNIIT